MNDNTKSQTAEAKKTVLTEMATLKAQGNLKLRISEALKDYPTLKLSEINDLQGNLKDLSVFNMDKLAIQLHTRGFIFPLYVWKDKKGKNWFIDGHQRSRTITEWYGSDVQLPYTLIHAANRSEAKAILLAASSQYGKTTLEGLDAFKMDMSALDLANIEIGTTFDIDFGKPFEFFDSETDESDNTKSTHEAVEDDYIQPEPEKIKTNIKHGDLITIGQHRLLCGDSTDVKDVEKVMNGEKADMVFTDPPYGISIVSKSSSKVGGGGETKFGKVGGGKIVEAKTYSEIIGDDTTDTAKRFYNTCISLGMENFIIWGGNYFTDFLKPSMCWIVWDKENTGNFADVEMAWTSFNKGAKLYKWLWNGMSRKGSRHIEGKTRVHPTQKPVGLFVNIFNDFDFKICYDGFLGSGSTMLAAHQLNRKCYGLELDEKYCQVIIDRMLNYDASLIVTINGKPYTPEVPIF